jgi:hypothetical protein
MTTNRKWRAGLAAAITAVAVGGWGTTAWGASAGTSPHAQSTPAAVTPQPCGTATGPFHVSGDQVLNANGDPFVSYGMTVGGLQQSAWPTLTTADDQRIDGAAQYWCVNTIRLQIQQDYLVGVGSTPPQAGYLAAIESEVARAESHHMVVVLNDQTEGRRWWTASGPTARPAPPPTAGRTRRPPCPRTCPICLTGVWGWSASSW